MTLIGLGSLFAYSAFSLHLFSYQLEWHYDAQFYKLWVDESFRYGSSPLDQSIISPVQGLGGLTQPIGAWIHPGFLPGYLLGGVVNGIIANYLVIIACYVLAALWLGRMMELSLRNAVIGAQVLGILMFTPVALAFFDVLSLRALYDYFLTPALALPVALGTLLVATFLLLGTRGRAANLVCTVAMPAIVIYSVACDPLYTAICMVGPAFLLLGVWFGSPSRPIFWWRTAGLGACLVVCLAARLPELYWAFSNYSARGAFPKEIASGALQDFGSGTPWMMDNVAGLCGGLVLLVACGLIIKWGSRQQKGIAAALIGFQLFLLAIGLVYVYAGIRWSLPTPDYFSQGAVPAQLMAVALCLQMAWPRRLKYQPGVSQAPSSALAGGKRARRRKLRFRAYASMLALPLMMSAVVGIWGLTAVDLLSNTEPLEGPIVSYLLDEIAIGPDGEFRGNVVTVAGVPGGPIARVHRVRDDSPWSQDAYNVVEHYLRTHFDTRLGIRFLWNLGIPTLEHNSQLITSPHYFVFSRALSRPVDYQFTNYSLATVVRPRLMAAFGTRFLITDEFYTDDQRLTLRVRQADASLPDRPTSFGPSLQLYELARPNTGNYSPTKTRVVPQAREMIRVMISDDFDFEREVILHQPLDNAPTLVPATGGKMYFERGGLRVQANSPGTSLLVLPVEFSNSLQIVSSGVAGGEPKLLRANLLLTGVLFSGDLDIKIAHVFGLFRGVAGRLRDIEDCRALGIVETREVPYPPGTMPRALGGD